MPAYTRVPVQNDFPPFIAALANLARRALAAGPGLCAITDGKICPRTHTQCPHRLAGIAA